MRTFTNTFAINGAFGIGQNRCVKMVVDRKDHAALHLALLPRYASLAAVISTAKHRVAVAAAAVATGLERLSSSPMRLQPCWRPTRRGSLGSLRG